MKTLIVVVVVAAFAAFAWYLLPSPPRPEAEQPSGGHASHAGDKVKFHADAIGGAFTVMKIEPAN